MDFTIPVDHIGKMKESEKIDKYLDLAGELKSFVVPDSCADVSLMVAMAVRAI